VCSARPGLALDNIDAEIGRRLRLGDDLIAVDEIDGRVAIPMKHDRRWMLLGWNSREGRNFQVGEPADF
jgi:hypothetical protein